MEYSFIILGGFILIAYTLEAITGFGSIIIALALGSLVLPMEVVLPILVACNIPMSSTIAFKNRKSIHAEFLLKKILPYMLLGTLAGYLIKPYINADILKLAFGVLIIWFGARELLKIYRKYEEKPRAKWLTSIITFCAGITHGLFASGGPLLVYAVAGTKIDKSSFRATMIVVWASMNIVLSIMFLLDGSLQPLFKYIIWYLPLLLVAVMLGNYLHDRLEERSFRLGVYYTLLLTGVILLASR